MQEQEILDMKTKLKHLEFTKKKSAEAKEYTGM